MTIISWISLSRPIWPVLKSYPPLCTYNWILKLGVVYSALIHLSYNLPQAKNKIKPWHQFGNILLAIQKITGEGSLILVNLEINLVTVVLIFFNRSLKAKRKNKFFKRGFFNKPSCWQIKWQAPLLPADSLAGSLLTWALGQTDWFNWQSCLKTCRGIDAEWIISFSNIQQFECSNATKSS